MQADLYFFSGATDNLLGLEVEDRDLADEVLCFRLKFSPEGLAEDKLDFFDVTDCGELPFSSMSSKLKTSPSSDSRSGRKTLKRLCIFFLTR